MKSPEFFILALLLGPASFGYANDGLAEKEIKALAQSGCIDNRA